VNPGSGAIDRARRGGLALVMVGALSVSVRGQVQAVGPLLGGMSVVLALTNDLAALLALNELMSTPRRAVRRWAWAVLVLASGTAAGLNTWHALQAGTLPPLWAVVVGIGPVLLAVVLSHLVALVLSDEPEQPGVDDAVEAAATTRAPTPAATSGTASVERPSPTPAGASSVELSRAAAQVPSRPCAARESTTRGSTPAWRSCRPGPSELPGRRLWPVVGRRPEARARHPGPIGGWSGWSRSCAPGSR
jgi:hypothetical protein